MSTRELRIAIPMPLEDTDPYRVASSTSRNVLRSVFEPLIDRERGFAPGLAAEWAPSGEREWTIVLRDDVGLHDGSTLDADGVLAAYERFVDPATQNILAGAFAEFEQFEARDTHTIVLRTREPSAAVPFALGRFPISSAPDGRLSGSGPFRDVEVNGDGVVTMEAHAPHWRDAPKVERATWIPMAAAADRVAAVEAGDVHLASVLTPSDVNRELRRARIVRQRNILSSAIVLNCGREPLTDTRVRQAINFAVDRERILQDILRGWGEVLTAPIGPAYFGYNPTLQPYPHDPPEARRLLHDAGAERFELTITTCGSRYPLAHAVAELVANDLNDVGVDTRLQDVQWAPFVQGIKDKSMDAFYFQVSTMATERLLRNEFSSRFRGVGWHHYKNDTVDQLLEDAARTLDAHTRRAMYETACAELHHDPPWLFLFNEDDVYAAAPELSGWTPHANGFFDVGSATLDGP